MTLYTVQSTTVYNLAVAGLHTFYVGVGAGGVLVYNAGCPAATNYRGRYFAERRAQGLPELPDDWDVHHRIPQMYRGRAGFEDFDFDHPDNLRGIQGKPPYNDHNLITQRWNVFARENPDANRAEIEDFANTIDNTYGELYW